MLLAGQVIFLTGGSAGIGMECARAYLGQGANVAVAALDDADLQRAAAELGDHAVVIPCDVADAAQVQQAVDATAARFGRLTAIHNNAGIPGPSRSLDETTGDEWNRLFAVNVAGIHHTTKAGIAYLRQARGAILNTSSVVGQIGQVSHAAYVATKGAVNALTRAMALDYAQDGVRVNAVCPAGVWTPMLRSWAADQPQPESVSAYLDSIHPLGACPEADVVADACVFLLSERARFITGHLMNVTGGAELGYRQQS